MNASVQGRGDGTPGTETAGNEPSPTTQGLRLPQHTNTGVRVAEEIQPYDSDHTALVHVLWAAERGGITISDADELASHIMRSKWMKAVRLHAR